MQLFLTYISNRIKAIEHKRAVGFDKTVLALELIYLRAAKKKKPSFVDGIAATKNIVVAHMFLFEFYFLIFGITLLVFANGAFNEPGVDYGYKRPILFLSGGVFAGLLPLVLAFVTTPFHLLVGAGLWLLTTIHVILTSLIFSIIQPYFAGLLLDKGIMGFEELFLPLLYFYGMAEFYMLSRLNTTLSFQRYQARHRPPSIEGLIPTHKSGALLFMSSQDHYVEIVTENGGHLERLTMKTAVELVPEATGLQVHRSHWVAYKAMLRLEKSADRYAISLRNGVKIPVGKSKVAEVRAFLEKS